MSWYDISNWDTGTVFFLGSGLRMVNGLVIMILASVFIQRSWNGFVFVFRMNVSIFFVGLFLFLLELLSITRLRTQGFIHTNADIFITISAFLYYFLDLRTYWIFAFKYYTSSSQVDQIINEASKLRQEKETNSNFSDTLRSASI